MLLREVQAAYMLGYSEMLDFRAAVKSGDVPGPSRKIKAGRRTVDVWSRSALEEWVENRNGTAGKKRSIDAAIGRL